MFVVIDGLDGCGKSTQLNLIEKSLKKSNINYKKIKLPDYDSPACAAVNMYLHGEFGDKPEDVNAYAATAFFAVDRFANFALKWKKDYENGVNIIADRYTTSNALHQASKLPAEEVDGYLDWLWDFEYKKIGIPEPDLVIFLDMPVEISQRLMSERYAGNESKKDVHEKDIDYLNHCRKSALYTAKKYGWCIIKCNNGDEPRKINDINIEIMEAVNSKLNA